MFWKLRVFCFLLISGKQVNLSTSPRSEPTWAVTGMNWQVFTLTDDSRKRSWSWSCLKWINLKVRNDDISRRKYAIDCRVVSNYSQEVFVWQARYKQSAEFLNFNYEPIFGLTELKLDRLSAYLTTLKEMEAISVYRRCFLFFSFICLFF